MSVRFNPGPPLAAMMSQVTVPSTGAVNLPNGQPKNVVSTSLQPGIYLLWALVNFALATATTNGAQAGLSLVSQTLPTQAGGGGLGPDAYSIAPLNVTLLSTTQTQIIGPTQLTLTAATTVYLVAQVSLVLGTVSAYGTMSAMQIDCP